MSYLIGISTSCKGRIYQAPTITEANGSKVANCILAVENGQDHEGNKITDFIDCAFWGRDAELIMRYPEGHEINIICGKLSASAYQDKADKLRVRYKVTVFDDKSIEIFYGYAIGNSTHYFCKLVDSVIKTWVNHDCPDLIRYTVNTKREKNWAGLNLLFWSDVVYQDDGYNVSVDELLEDEYNAFEKAMNHNWYCWEKINEAWNNQHSEQNADEVLAAVKAYEFEVQEMINTYQPELESYKATLEEVPMDCGFTMIYTSNEMINKHISFLKSRDIRSVDYLEVSFPYDYFSVSNSYKIFEKFKSLSAGNPLMSELSVRTRYD